MYDLGHTIVNSNKTS